MYIKWEPDMLAAAQDFASNNTVFMREFASAWNKIMIIDRFDGPTGKATPKEKERKKKRKGRWPQERVSTDIRMCLIRLPVLFFLCFSSCSFHSFLLSFFIFSFLGQTGNLCVSSAARPSMHMQSKSSSFSDNTGAVAAVAVVATIVVVLLGVLIKRVLVHKKIYNEF